MSAEESSPELAPRETETPWPPTESGEVGMASILSFLIRRSRLLVGVPVLAGVVTAAASLFQAPTYTASTSFVPESDSRASSSGALAGLASQFGVSLPSPGQNSPVYYAMILGSRSLRTDLLHAKFPDPRSATAADSVELIRYFKSLSTDQGLRDLDAITKIELDPRTNVTTLRVTTGSPQLSAQIAIHALDLLNVFNSRTKRSRATELRSFIEGRVVQTRLELEAAEEDMRHFREANRQYTSSPGLAVEYERLQRRVAIKQEVYVSQLRQLEEVRIAEENTVPAITIIDPAIAPEVRSGPLRTRNTLFAIAIGLMVGFFSAIVADYAARVRHGDVAGFASLQKDWLRLRGSMRRS